MFTHRYHVHHAPKWYLIFWEQMFSSRIGVNAAFQPGRLTAGDNELAD